MQISIMKCVARRKPKTLNQTKFVDFLPFCLFFTKFLRNIIQIGICKDFLSLWHRL